MERAMRKSLKYLDMKQVEKHANASALQRRYAAFQVGPRPRTTSDVMGAVPEGEPIDDQAAQSSLGPAIKTKMSKEEIREKNKEIRASLRRKASQTSPPVASPTQTSPPVASPTQTSPPVATSPPDGTVTKL